MPDNVNETIMKVVRGVVREKSPEIEDIRPDLMLVERPGVAFARFGSDHRQAGNEAGRRSVRRAGFGDQHPHAGRPLCGLRQVFRRGRGPAVRGRRGGARAARPRPGPVWKAGANYDEKPATPEAKNYSVGCVKRTAIRSGWCVSRTPQI